MQAQRGEMVLLAALTLGVVAAAVMGMYVAWFGGLSAPARLQAKKAWVDRAAADLSTWYGEHPAEMDGQSEPVVPGCSAGTATCLLTAAGVQPRYDAQLSVGDLVISGEGFSYRTLTLWIPLPTLPAAERGTFAPASAVVWASVPGASIERDRVGDARRQMATLAQSLQDGYSAWLASSGNGGADWFEPAGTGCGPFGANGALSVCADVWADVSDMGLNAAAGWAGNGTDPWGGSIQMCTTSACGAQDGATPFTALLRDVTPWGTTLSVMVAEPLQAS